MRLDKRKEATMPGVVILLAASVDLHSSSLDLLSQKIHTFACVICVCLFAQTRRVAE